jgi:hypothetical protein
VCDAPKVGSLPVQLRFPITSTAKKGLRESAAFHRVLGEHAVPLGVTYW